MEECKNCWPWAGFGGRIEEKISCSGKDWWYFEIAHHKVQLLPCISLPGNTLFSSMQLPGKLNRRLLLFQDLDWKINVLVCCSRVNLQGVSVPGCWNRLKSAHRFLFFMSKADLGSDFPSRKNCCGSVCSLPCLQYRAKEVKGADAIRWSRALP